VLQGSSIHSTYSFEQQLELDDGLRFGTLTRHRVEVLERGSSRAIEPGSGLIHSLFHLDHPSVSLVVRTHGEAAFRPQWDYHPPGIALDPTIPLSRRFDALIAVLRMNRDGFEEAAVGFLGAAPPTIAFRLLQRAAMAGVSRERLRALMASVPQLVGEKSERLAMTEAALDARVHQHNIVARREAITNPDQRFLLAALLLLEGRQQILDAVARRSGDGDPVAIICNQLEAMGTEALGVAMDEVAIEVLRGLLAGEPEADIASRVGDPGRVAKLCLTLPRTRILGNLFR
jgi:hypothetical protein